jgi:hypothetical protein
MAKKALIAGWGELPRIWAEKAAAQAEDFIVIKIAEEITADFSDLELEEYTINLAQLNKMIELMLKKGVKEIILLGKVQKHHLFQDFEPDLRLKRLLAALPNLNDDTILLALVNEFIESGIKVLPQTYLLDDLLLDEGVLTGELYPDLKKDMEFAFKTAYNLGRFDIGQTALVKNSAVMALEAVEGTDKAIQRAAEYGGQGVVMAKCSKKEQDFRFDVPAVGLKTLEHLIENKAAGLIIEAKKTFVLDKEQFCRRAEEAGLVTAAAAFDDKGEMILPWQN